MSRSILFVTTGLETGGAETCLVQLLSAIRRDAFQCAVVSLQDKGTMGARIEAMGIPVTSLEFKPGPQSFAKAYAKLSRVFAEVRPDVVHGWMYHGNLVAFMLAARSRKPIGLLWTIHQTVYSMNNERALTRLVIRVGAWLSRNVGAITYVSEVSRTQHSRLGFTGRIALTLPNGFDMRRFMPVCGARERLRAELGLGMHDLIVGHVARFHPMKDQKTLLEAAALMRETVPMATFVLVGRGLDPSNEALSAMISERGLDRTVRLLGERSDVAELLSAFDVFCLSSAWGEAFPMVIGESLACGVPCVATRIGDAPLIVGSHGSVVEPRDHTALARELSQWLSVPLEHRQRIGLSGRDFVQSNFEIGRIARRYEDLYMSLAT